MSLTSFRVTNQKALQLAENHSVPRVMVIAGPNGVGKSTLLFAIKQNRGQVQCTGRKLYLSPHRIWRRQQIHLNTLWEVPRRYADFLTQDSISGFGGLRILDGNRAPDSADESPSAVKYTLSQVETRKQTAVTQLLEQKGIVTKDDVGDIYKPVQELTQFLLPHLTFSRIDITARENVRCLWKRVDSLRTIEVDLDDLSSGERAIVSLFMPFLEKLIEQRLNKIENAVKQAEPPSQEDLVVLIDEPELHLHPLLQGRLLEYLRLLTIDGKVQFILATHSPTLIGAADFTELFVLSPPTTDPSFNQLRQLATSSDRMDLIKTLCGESHILTSCRSILCLEGEFTSSGNNIATDTRLYELLCPEISRFVLLPCGGRANVIETARRLREIQPAIFPVETVAALVDADQAATPLEDPWVVSLPVAMIENLLLIPEVIWEFLSPYKEKVGLSSAVEVKAALVGIANSLREEEIDLRVRNQFKAYHATPRGTTVAAVRESIEQHVDAVRSLAPKDDTVIQSFIERATAEVDGIIRDNQQLLKLRGKQILKAFHRDYVNGVGVGYSAFALQLARMLRSRPDDRKLLTDAISMLTNQTPGVGQTK